MADVHDFCGWPLFCRGASDIYDCYASGKGSIPHALIHLGISYTAALAVAILRRTRGLTWSHFSSVFDVAWHCPNIVTCVPMSLMY